MKDWQTWKKKIDFISNSLTNISSHFVHYTEPSFRDMCSLLRNKLNNAKWNYSLNIYHIA